jgi:predicted transcriptional regulator
MTHKDKYFFKRMRAMCQSILEMAKDLVIAQVQTSKLSLEEMYAMLQATHANLMELKGKEDAREDSAKEEKGTIGLGMDWKNSIKKSSIICLVCGAAFKQLSIRHLKDHGLDAHSYRVKYGIPRKQPLSAKNTTAIRKHIVQQNRPWEKAPRYVQAHTAVAQPAMPPPKKHPAPDHVEPVNI